MKWRCIVVVVAACGHDHSDVPHPDAMPVCPQGQVVDLGESCGAITVPDGCAAVEIACNAPAVCGGQGVAGVCAIPNAQQRCDQGWCWEAPAPMSSIPAATAVVSATDLWSVGQRGQVRHFDGTRWSEVDVPTTVNLHGVWMASASDGWIVGDSGLLLRWNGSAWTAVASGTTASLHAVSGKAANDVWIAGPSVTEHWNGSAWTAATTSTPDLDRIYAGPDVVWGVGESQVWKLAGTSWVAQDSSVFADNFAGIIGSASDAWAIGYDTHLFDDPSGVAYHWDGSAWTYAADQSGGNAFREAFFAGTTPYTVDAHGITELGGNRDHVETVPSFVLTGGGIAGQFFAADAVGRLWSVASPKSSYYGFGTRTALTAVARVGTKLWIGGAVDGDSPVAFTWDHGFSKVAAYSNPFVSFGAFSGAADNDVWAIAYDPFAAMGSTAVHFDGTSWTAVAFPSGVSLQALDVVAGTPWFAGSAVYRYSAGAWVADTFSAPAAKLRAIADNAGDIYIAGSQTPTNASETGTVWKNHAGTWSALAAPGMQMVCGLAVTSASDIWVAGYDGGDMGTATGKVAHWNGSGWTTTAIPGAYRLCAIGVHGGEVWASGGGVDTFYDAESPLFHRSAAGVWTAQALLGLGTVHAFYADGTTLWAVGDGGAILRHD